MRWFYDDGGREAAGLPPNPRGDCVARAITIATQKPYHLIHGELRRRLKRYCERHGHRRRGWDSPDNGVPHDVFEPYLKGLGWKKVIPGRNGHIYRMRLGRDALPKGRAIVDIDRHLVAVVDGVCHDTYDTVGAHQHLGIQAYWVPPEKRRVAKSTFKGDMDLILNYPWPKNLDDDLTSAVARMRHWMEENAGEEE